MASPITVALEESTLTAITQNELSDLCNYVQISQAIKDEDAFAAFLKKNDVEGTVQDFGKAVKAKGGAEGEISDDVASTVDGGRYLWWDTPTLFS